MNEHAQVLKLSEFLRLTPFQTYILEKNYRLYNLARLVKRGGVLYVPYLNNPAHPWRDAAMRLVMGPRVDLIGPERMLVSGGRGVKLYSDGHFIVSQRGANVR